MLFIALLGTVLVYNNRLNKKVICIHSNYELHIKLTIYVYCYIHNHYIYVAISKLQCMLIQYYYY